MLTIPSSKPVAGFARGAGITLFVMPALRRPVTAILAAPEAPPEGLFPRTSPLGRNVSKATTNRIATSFTSSALSNSVASDSRNCMSRTISSTSAECGWLMSSPWSNSLSCPGLLLFFPLTLELFLNLNKLLTDITVEETRVHVRMPQCPSGWKRRTGRLDHHTARRLRDTTDTRPDCEKSRSQGARGRLSSVVSRQCGRQSSPSPLSKSNKISAKCQPTKKRC